MKQIIDFKGEVSISDITVRDGIQAEERVIPRDAKLFIINRLIEAGFREMEVTAFAPPKYQPQFADFEQVLAGLPKREDVTYSCVAMLAAIKKIPVLVEVVPRS